MYMYVCIYVQTQLHTYTHNYAHTHTYIHTYVYMYACMYVSGLKPGRIIRVTICPGQVSLIRFIKYLCLTLILH